jgi:hypothetical protein
MTAYDCGVQLVTERDWQIEINHMAGVDEAGVEDSGGIAAAVAVARTADVTILVVGEV